jgi:hypothetical protein
MIMGVLLPVGYGNATFVFQNAGAPKEYTTSVAYNPSDLDPTAHAAAIHTAWASGTTRPFSASKVSNEYQLLRVDVVEMDDIGPLLGSQPIVVQGTFGSGSMPPNCCVLMNKNTASGGRKNRGRMYVPPVNILETQVTALGTIPSANQTAITTLFNVAIGDMIAAGLPPVLLHSEPGAPTPITNIACTSVIATQRRRLR